MAAPPIDAEVSLAWHQLTSHYCMLCFNHPETSHTHCTNLQLGRWCASANLFGQLQVVCTCTTGTMSAICMGTVHIGLAYLLAPCRVTCNSMAGQQFAVCILQSMMYLSTGALSASLDAQSVEPKPVTFGCKLNSDVMCPADKQCTTVPEHPQQCNAHCSEHRA